MFSGNLFNYYSSGVYYLAKDGIVYQFDNMYLDDDDADLPPHKQKIGYIYIHINGMQGHSLDGEDRFYFTLFNDGSLKPKGAQGWGGEKTWRTECPAGGIPDDYSYCAGHIFENNLKVLYK